MNKINNLVVNTKAMTIKSIEFDNFKCFNTLTKIDIKKLTILTGANSAGKTSILYTMLAPLQSSNFPASLALNGEYVEMGDFKAVSNRHKENPISLNFNFIYFGTEFRLESKWLSSKKNSQPELQEFIVSNKSTSLTLRKTTDKYAGYFKYQKDKDSDSNDATGKEIYEQVIGTLIKHTSDSKAKENLQKMINTLNKDASFAFTLPKAESLANFATKKQNSMFEGFVREIFSLFKSFENNFNFISSFRLHPNRTYLELRKSQGKLTKYGDGTLDQILKWENSNSDELKELLTHMRDMKLVKNLKPKRMSGGRYELTVTPNDKSIAAALVDVGFGISQFLPIIVADLQLSEGSTLFVAQPEIHLHPNAQSLFGDYVSKQINKANKNYIIETHSEYFLTKIRILIAKGVLKEQDVAIYYVQNEKNGAKVCPITFSKDGHINGAPSTFFDTYMMDKKQLALASLK
jgi:predicted ATPase